MHDAVNVRAFGAAGDGVTDDTAAFVRAVQHVFRRTRPGGTLLLPAGVYVLSSTIDLFQVLADVTGISVNTPFFPGTGDLVRGTYLGLRGGGYPGTEIRFTGTGPCFVWGRFVNPSSQRAMSGRVDGIDFTGPGSLGGHVSRVVLPGVGGTSGFATISTPLAGTSDTAATALELAAAVPTMQVTNCRFRRFDCAIRQRFGFGAAVTETDVQYCNLGVHLTPGVTTCAIGGGNEIELCAVGVYVENADKVSIGTSVIEANLAGCDVLLFLARFVDVRGTWFEGSPANVVLRTDPLNPTAPNRDLVFDAVVGLNIASNGGVTDLVARGCAMNALNEVFAFSTGNPARNIKYVDCTHGGAAFDVSRLDVSGIHDAQVITVEGVTTNAARRDFGAREPLLRRRHVTSSATSAARAFALRVANPAVRTTCRIEIRGYKRASPGDETRMQTQRWVGVLLRDRDRSTVVQFSAAESATTDYAATGTAPPITVAVPVTAVAGAATATQTVDVRFVTGTAAGAPAENFWEAVLHVEDGDVTFA